MGWMIKLHVSWLDCKYLGCDERHKFFLLLENEPLSLESTCGKPDLDSPLFTSKRNINKTLRLHRLSEPYLCFPVVVSSWHCSPAINEGSLITWTWNEWWMMFKRFHPKFWWFINLINLPMIFERFGSSMFFHDFVTSLFLKSSAKTMPNHCPDFRSRRSPARHPSHSSLSCSRQGGKKNSSSAASALTTKESERP